MSDLAVKSYQNSFLVNLLPENKTPSTVSKSKSPEKIEADRLLFSDTLKSLIPFENKKVIPKALPINGDFTNITEANAKDQSGEIRFMFFSDAHSRFQLLEKFIDQSNKQKPDLVIDGGDMSHDGTEPELKKAAHDRTRIEAPVYLVKGNHDAKFRGPFNEPPKEIPPFQSFDAKGVHFILLDNQNEKLTEEQFGLLAEDLEKNKNKPTVVSVHVPPKLSEEGKLTKVIKKLPLNFASPVMTETEQVEKFMDLMSKYKVKAVLSGHTHKQDYFEKDGVKYINAGAVGGLTPGWGIDQEYLDLAIKDGELKFSRVTLKENSSNPLVFLGESFKYYLDLNTFNHNQLGWEYLPSASVQFKAGGKVSESKNGVSNSSTITAAFERQQSDKGQFFADATVTAGTKDLNLKIEGGYKYHFLGDYNRGVFVGAAVGANGGIVVGKPSAGVGAEVSAGIDYKNFTFEVSHERATNYNATSAAVGYRF